MVTTENYSSKSLFVGFYQTEIYLYYLIKKFSNKKLSDLDLISSKNLLNNINNKYFKIYNKIYDFPLIDSANYSSLRIELNLFKIIKQVYFVFIAIIKLKNVFKNNDYESIYFSDSSEGILISRVIIYLSRKKKVKIFRLGYCQYRFNRKSNKGLINFLNNHFFFMLPKVRCIVSDKKSILLERQFVENFYSKRYLYSSLKDKIEDSNLINFEFEKSHNTKNKIYFFDRGQGLLVFYNYDINLYNKYFNEIILKLSNLLSNNFELIFKPHPKQDISKLNIHNFKLSNKNERAEDLLFEQRDEIFAVFGISSTSLRFADLLGINTFSLRYLFNFDDNEAFENIFVPNTNINHIKSLRHLTEIISKF